MNAAELKTREKRIRTTVATLVLLCAGAAIGAGQTVGPRALAAYDAGETGVDKPLWKTWLAVGSDQAVAVYNWGQVLFESADWVGYAIANYDPNDPNEPWKWSEEDLIDAPPQFSGIVDPSIVYQPPDPNDPNDLGRFVAAAFANSSDQGTRNAVLYWEYDPAEPNSINSVWKPVAYRNSLDKPWIVRGQHTAAGREYYIIWDSPEGYTYLRTRDGWQHWTKPESGSPLDLGGKTIRVGAQAITGGFAAQPTANPDDASGALYIAYLTDTGIIRFLKGVDDNTDPNDPSVTFSKLLRLCGFRATGFYQQPLAEVVLNTAALKEYLPLIHKAHTVAWPLVDPTNANRMYVVYQDTVDADPDPNDVDVDVDVFVRTLTRYGSGWCVSDRVRVNQDNLDPNNPPATPADQFLPSATIDSLGRLHIIYYDDRRYPSQVDGQSPAKLDVYHAIGEYDAPNDTVVILSDTRLYAADPNNPNDAETLLLDSAWRRPGEYVGVAYDPLRDEVLTTYAGSDPNKPGSYKQVIYSSHVTDLP